MSKYDCILPIFIVYINKMYISNMFSLESNNRISPSPVDGTHQVSLVAKKVLNGLRSRRIIGRPESIHVELSLPLCQCSETMVQIRISGWKRLINCYTKDYVKKSNDFIVKYCHRTTHDHLSVWAYFDYKYNQENESDTLYIPYSTGMNFLLFIL